MPYKATSPLIPLGLALLLLHLAGCATTVTGRAPTAERQTPATKPAMAKRGGGYYQDDGPGDNPPPNLEATPDATPKAEPLHKFANNPYSALGQTYVPETRFKSFTEKGLASWYGKKFHGQKTSSGERYDMYAMTAAHRTLPIPSYARVTNLKTNKSVVVRINDRGPFHADRVVDLSYTAAYKLGIVQNGSAMVEVAAIDPSAPEMPTVAAAQPTANEPGPAPIAASAADAAPASGLYLQMGAFRMQANAEQLRDRVKARLSNLADAIQVRAVDGVFRVHLGPLRSRDEANQIAAELVQSLNLKSLIVSR